MRCVRRCHAQRVCARFDVEQQWRQDETRSRPKLSTQFRPCATNSVCRVRSCSHRVWCAIDIWNLEAQYQRQVLLGRHASVSPPPPSHRTALVSRPLFVENGTSLAHASMEPLSPGSPTHPSDARRQHAAFPTSAPSRARAVRAPRPGRKEQRHRRSTSSAVASSRPRPSDAPNAPPPHLAAHARRPARPRRSRAARAPPVPRRRPPRAHAYLPRRHAARRANEASPPNPASTRRQPAEPGPTVHVPLSAKHPKGPQRVRSLPHFTFSAPLSSDILAAANG